jgi:hypothetical protein
MIRNLFSNINRYHAKHGQDKIAPKLQYLNKTILSFTLHVRIIENIQLKAFIIKHDIYLISLSSEH